MKSFMLIGIIEEQQFARFSDNYNEISAWKMDVECGLGGYAEIYIREKFEYGYEYRLLEA